MDLKNILTEKAGLTFDKKVSPWLIYALGLFGAGVIVVALWIGWTDWRIGHAAAAAAAEARQIVEQLRKPVQELNRVLSDSQVQDLARRAIDNPATEGDLYAYLHGRLGSILEVRVFGPDALKLDAGEIGPNGYAILDMVLSVLGGGRGLVQIHYILDPPRMYQAVPVQRDGAVAGVLVVGLDPDFLLSAFNPEYGSLGAVRLVQFSGRQPVKVLRELGDTARFGEQPERVIVPGTMLRIEYPRVAGTGLLGSGMLFLLIVVGAVCLSAALLLNRSNRKWAVLQQGRGMAPAGNTAVQPQREPPSREPGEGDADFGASPAAAGEAGSEGPEAPATEQPLPMHLHYDIAERRRRREPEHQPVELKKEIFRAYDIRGVINETLDSGVARSIGQAIGSLSLERGADPLVVARDGRLSGPYLMDGMIEGIVSTGCDAIDIGAVPTGVLYYAAFELGAGSGVMITGSHNPPDYNGFKILIGGETLHGDAIAALYNRIVSGNLKEGQGEVTRKDVIADYIDRIASDIKLEKPLRVVIDCGNGIGGVCAADTLRAIGAEVMPLFDEVDGTFPNHHPDPSEPENLRDLIESVRLMDADLGLALDGDADRLGVVTLAGNIIYPDRIMMLLAMDVLDRNPGATIIYDVKCTNHLPDVIRQAGGKPEMYKTGHSLIKARMKEVGAPFAGEMSGHFFFAERWYGVDDGLYAAARLLEILASTETPPEAILNALPTSFSTPELKVQMQEGENHAFIEAFRQAATFEGAEISTIDGLRADFSDGWGLVRASNTTPILVVRFDAESEEALERIKSLFREQMLALRQDLDLPF